MNFLKLNEEKVVMVRRDLDMENKVLELVREYFRHNIESDIPYYQLNLFIVWSCYILGNRKYLVGASNSDLYFEVTYNKDKDEWYIDQYIKVKNVCIVNKTNN